ncbi:MAG: hypothetical protein ACFHHU_04550 [Porticoccaceae bacterium]
MDSRLIKSQASYFSDFNELTPSPSNWKRILEAFEDFEDFTPSTSKYFGPDSNGNMVDRPQLLDTNNGLSINFNPSRVDIHQEAKDPSSSNMLNKKDFTDLAVKIHTNLIKLKDINLSRISVVFDRFISTPEGKTIEDYQASIAPMIILPDGVIPFEWNSRAAYSDSLSFSDLGQQELNKIVNISRVSGHFQTGVTKREFDCLNLQTDINTKPINMEQRFNTNHVAEFFEHALDADQKLYDQISSTLTE